MNRRCNVTRTADRYFEEGWQARAVGGPCACPYPERRRRDYRRRAWLAGWESRDVYHGVREEKERLALAAAS